MKINIAIYTSYGLNNIPEGWNIEKINTIEGRIKLADKILNMVPVEGSIDEVDEIIRTVKPDYFRLKDILYYRDKELGGYQSIEVVEIDTDKPWRINEYDGSEYVEYFNGIEVVDKIYNMCTW